jgi:plastocyanin/uncharacterized membrane protein YozB (DUF420 family)
MFDILGTRTASNINLAVQILLLLGLLAGFVLARQKRFAQHANVQTAMVLLNLFPIAVIMVPGFIGYVDYLRAGGATSDRVLQLMFGHGILGIVAEVFALYLVIRMRTSWLPERLRVRNIKLAMRTALGLWVVVVLIGVGIYAERYVFQRTAAIAPLLEFRQLGADLYVHAVELSDAQSRDRLPAVKRHAEHLINLIEGQDGLHYGDNDTDGHLEDPGDGVGLLARLDTVAGLGAIADEPTVNVQADAIRGQLDRIVALSVGLLGAQGAAETTSAVDEILALAQQANGEGVFQIDAAARAAGVEQAPLLMVAPEGAASSVTIHEDQFRFIPSQMTIPSGTTVVWVNDERAKHTASADDGSFDSGDQGLGVSYAHTFEEPGAYPYFCRYHGDIGGIGMAGTIVVE